jgi:hypothetical protein
VYSVLRKVSKIVHEAQWKSTNKRPHGRPEKRAIEEEVEEEADAGSSETRNQNSVWDVEPGKLCKVG